VYSGSVKRSIYNQYSIRQVIELTGVSEFTLRAWELRYGVVKPQRSKTGRRIYKHEDLLKIKILRDLVERGHRIGLISSLSLNDLQKKIEDRKFQSTGLSAKIKKTNYDMEISQIIKFVDRFEWPRVKEFIEIQQRELKAQDFILGFLTRLLNEVGHQVFLKQFSIVQEHIITSYVKESLYFLRFGAKPKKKSKMSFVMATPEGDFHELGLLMAATLAAQEGLSCLYLGPNVPKVDICETCLRLNATHLLLSSTVSQSEGAKEDFLSFVNYIDRQLPQTVNLWIAGRNGQKAQVNLRRKYEIISSLDQFFEILKV
jgi:DNA-binding transcriptional MerR regulator